MGIIAISNHSFMLGGGEKSYLDLLSHLMEAWNILAVVPGEGELADRLRQNGIKTEIAALPKIRPWYVLSMLLSFKRYFYLFRTYRPELVYANGSRAAFYGGIIGRTLKIPVIWHCRVSERDPYFDFMLIRLVNRVIANSKATASRFPSYFQFKLDVVYNGFDLEWLKESHITKPAVIKKNWISILVVSRVSRSKRHDVLLSAFEKIALSQKNTHLICVGGKDHSDPAWWEQLQERTINSPLSNRIHWIGAVDDVRPWYRGASMMILPSANEAFGRVVVEAMASGVPVIATRSGGIPEIVTHMQNGILVPENNVEAISEAIMKLLQDESLKKRLAEEGLKHAERFSMDLHIERMVKVFMEVIYHSKKG